MKTHKKCSKCGLLKPAAEFRIKHKRAVAAGQKIAYLSAKCKQCLSAYMATYRRRPKIAKKLKKYFNRYRIVPENKQRQKINSKNWYLAHREECIKSVMERQRRLHAQEKAVGHWKWFHRTRWRHMSYRAINGVAARLVGNNAPAAKWHRHEVKLKLTRVEFKQFCKQHRRKIKRMHLAGECPSIDRIDTTGHYELGNLQIIPNAENSIKDCRQPAYVCEP